MRAVLSKIAGAIEATEPTVQMRRAAVLAIAALVAACVAPSPPPSGQGRVETAQPPAETGSARGQRPTGEGPPSVALLVPQSAAGDKAAALGRALADAARMARSEAGRQGAPRLSVYDTAGRARTAAAAAERAIADGADLILGPLFAENTAAVGRAVAGRGVPVLSFSNDSAVAGGPVWITGSTPEAEARAILTHAARRGLRAVGVFRPETDYGAKALDGARAGAAGRLSPVVSYQRSFVGIETASRGFVEDALAQRVDAVLLPAGGDELQTVGSFLNYHGLDPSRVQYLGLRKWNSEASFQEPALKGGWFVGADPERVERFATRFAEATGAPPPPLAHLGYDAMRVAIRLVARSGGRAPFTRRALTARAGFEGALGRFRFGPDQIAEQALAVLEVGEGQFRLRAPARMPVAGSS